MTSCLVNVRSFDVPNASVAVIRCSLQPALLVWERNFQSELFPHSTVPTLLLSTMSRGRFFFLSIVFLFRLVSKLFLFYVIPYLHYIVYPLFGFQDSLLIMSNRTSTCSLPLSSSVLTLILQSHELTRKHSLAWHPNIIPCLPLDKQTQHPFAIGSTLGQSPCPPQDDLWKPVRGALQLEACKLRNPDTGEKIDPFFVLYRKSDNSTSENELWNKTRRTETV